MNRASYSNSFTHRNKYKITTKNLNTKLTHLESNLGTEMVLKAFHVIAH